MANEQNLIPFSERTESEQREIQSSGGRASGAARRRKKSLKEAADLFLSLGIKNKEELEALKELGLDADECDQQMGMIVGLTMSAKQGNAKAAKVVIELIGEGHDDGQRAEQVEQHSALIEAIKGMK